MTISVKADALRRPIRIGIVLHDFALGGTERIAVRLANAWAERGMRVTLFCGSTDGPLSALLGERVEVAAADPPIARTRGSRRRLGQRAAEHWKRQPVDVVFVPGNYHWPAIAPIARMAASVRPVVVAQVSASLDKPQRGRLRRWAFEIGMRRMLRDANAIAVLFDKARRDADRIVGGARNIALAARARSIALPALADDVAPPKPLPVHRTIVAAGRLVPEKGFADLIDAFALLADPAARLVIVGAGPERDALLERVHRHDLADRVVLPGYVDDIRPWLDDARLFVLSSHFEGYPAVLVEALGAGRPIVATRCTSAIDSVIASRDTGRTVPVGAPAEMALAIADMLDAPHPDPAMLAMQVMRHRIGPVADAYIDLFGHAMESEAAN